MDHPAGQEPMKVLGVILGIGLALLILVGFGYALIWWFQRGQCWCRPDFVFNPYHSCRSVAVELVPPFSISGSLSEAGSSYMPFHNQEP